MERDLDAMVMPVKPITSIHFLGSITVANHMNPSTYI
jgi:hypothetical protein